MRTIKNSVDKGGGRRRKEQETANEVLLNHPLCENVFQKRP